jgi:integrase
VRRFPDFLIEAGVATPRRREPSIEERYPLLQEFAAWQTRHRGLRASSVRAYLVVLERLLITVGTDPTTYTATRLREFVCNEGAKFGIERAATITVATRSLVRFLVATGRAPAGMDQAIPRAAIWGRFRSSLPRYIEPDDIERAIASCDPATPAGTRDRAIVLLLARLGLRAGEVAALRFDDIDWADGRIGVTGKGRRRHWLPLPQEVGDAILAYVRGVRPEVASAFVFVRLLAPFGGLRMETVANVAARSLRRSGVKAPTYGSHVFRHSVATTMLREGATLAGIGAVLRHRSPETTAHYAKVDIAMLAEIAQPWPEVSPC